MHQSNPTVLQTFLDNGERCETKENRTRTQLTVKSNQEQFVCILLIPPCKFLGLSFLPDKPPKLHHYSSRSQVCVFKNYHLISSKSALKSLKDVWSLKYVHPKSAQLQVLTLLSGISSCSSQAEPGFSTIKQVEGSIRQPNTETDE